MGLENAISSTQKKYAALLCEKTLILVRVIENYMVGDGNFAKNCLSFVGGRNGRSAENRWRKNNIGFRREHGVMKE